MAHEFLKLRKVHATTGYSHAAKVGNLLFISGQVAKNTGGQIVGKGDIAAQAKQVFANLSAIMQEAGGKMENIFKMTTLVTHPSFVQPYRDARKQFMKEPFPANTLHVVQSLAEPEWLIEIEAIADLG
jgi:enamine deaminase RidA (YjgF/YER057c/UK114 family)